MKRKKSGEIIPTEPLERFKWYYEEGSVIWTKHFKEELHNAGARKPDVTRVIQHRVSRLESVEYDSKFQNWKYRIAGPDTQDEWLTIVAAVDERNARVILITTF